MDGAQQDMRCPACGYDLRGLGHGRSVVRCPECGVLAEPGARRGLHPWPRAWRLAVWLWGPFALYVMTMLGAEHLPGRFGRTMEDLSGVVAWRAPMLLVGLPVLAAKRLAWRHAHPYEQRLIWAAMAAVGVLGNIGLLMAAMFVRVSFGP